jgi:putative membrane protein
MAIAWLKTFHIVFVVTWFAGLFYLPRLFVYHLDAHDAPSHERFVVMERRLLAITHIGGTLAVAFGVGVLLAWQAAAPGYLAQGWLHAKLALVALLIGYHAWCVALARAFRDGRNTRGSRWLRVFNEVPALLLIAIVALVVVRPF